MQLFPAAKGARHGAPAGPGFAFKGLGQGDATRQGDKEPWASIWLTRLEAHYEFPLRALGPWEPAKEVALRGTCPPALATEVTAEAYHRIQDGEGEAGPTLGYRDLYLLAVASREGKTQHPAVRSASPVARSSPDGGSRPRTLTQ